MKRFIVSILLLQALLLNAGALRSLFAQRYYAPIGVIGQTRKGLYNATITHTAESMRAARTIYLPDSEVRTFSFLLYPFPGENTLAFKNGSEEDVLTFYGRKLPGTTLKARLAWSGSNQDYDLHVNTVGYDNPEDDNGVLDHDWKRDSDEGSPIENITFTDTPADLYNIYVKYFNDHNYSGEEDGRGAVSTHVRVEWDGKVVFNERKLLQTVNSVWPITSFVVHAGEEVGGYAVQYDGLASPGIIPYPLQPPSEDNGVLYNLASEHRYQVSSFSGPRDLKPVYLRVGEAAQFNARGALNVDTPEQVNDLKLYDVFKTTGCGFIDELGVYFATQQGHCIVSHYTYDNEEPNPAVVEVYVIQPQLWIMADYNQDGCVDEYDKEFAVDGVPLRMWVNNDQSETSPDLIVDASNHLSQGNDLGDCSDLVVNGRTDLLDFFPIQFDLRNLLTTLPKEKFKYRLSHEDNAVNIVWTDVASIHSFYTVDDDGHGMAGPALDSYPYYATVTPITSNGAFIPETVLTAFNQNTCYAFLEGRTTTTKPLKLEIIPKDEPNTVAYTFNLPLSISDVSDMFRVLNLRKLENDKILEHSRLTDPVNYPDAETNGKYLFFIHGYNVSETNANGWAINVFKKLFRAGSKAAFTAIFWQGDDSRIIGTDMTPNYYLNVIHAFQTAPILKTYLSQWDGEKILLAHSLGNMLATSLLVDHNASTELNIKQYAMLNAAIPAEAFRDTLVESTMSPPSWDGLETRTYASNWHKLFTNSADGRAHLTWKNRFATLLQSTTNVYNFYSSTEDVLTLAPSSRDPGISTHPWVYQEYKKGTFLQYFLPGETACEGGWGKNRGAYDFWTTNTLNNLSDVELVSDPVFTPFASSLHVSTNTVVTIESNIRNRILADGIPALSHAVGAKRVSSFRRNIDMFEYVNSRQDDEWPQSIDGNSVWTHSTIRELAYFYVHRLFNELTTTLQLKDGL
jgi:pimeloyl-ACP methyl ester carboxylesterase